MAKIAAASYATDRVKITEVVMKRARAKELLQFGAKVACRFQEKMEKQDITWVRRQAKMKEAGIGSGMRTKASTGASTASKARIRSPDLRGKGLADH